MAAESLWLGLLGGVLSLFVADGLIALMQHWFSTVPQMAQVTLEPRTLALGLAVTAAAVAIASLAPIWRLSRAAPATVMNEGSRGARGRQQRRVQSALLAVQVCLSMVLLTGAGLMVRTLGNLQEVRLGFEPQDVLVADIALPPSRYSTDEDRQEFARRLRDTLAALPQVRGAAVSNSVPLWGSAGNWTYGVEGQTSPEDQGVVWVHAVTPEYFDVLGVPLKRGRMLRDQDAEACLVNEAFARYHWPGKDPLGHRVHLGPSDGPTCAVAGVVGDAHHVDLSQPPPVQLYTSLFNDSFQGNRYIYAYLETPGDPALFTRPLKDAVRTLDPDLAADPVRSLEQVLARALRRTRVASSLFTGFAILGLALAAVGLYGLVAFTVAQRTREMGIRQALGADAGRLVRMVLGQSLRLVGWGLAFGLLVSLALGPSMASFLYGVTPTDLPTLTVIVLLIVGVNLVAALVPAIRAASVRPAVALRED
jgi:predicted permease